MEGGERVVPVVGTQVAGYRIDALISRGGGGVVYRATHRRLGRTVALKLLAPELTADPEFQRRFEREALMASALDHPHIILSKVVWLRGVVAGGWVLVGVSQLG